MLDMPIDKMNNPSTTQPTFASVVSAFINCLKTRYTSQILTPNKIIGPRCTKNKIAAVNPAKNNKNNLIKKPPLRFDTSSVSVETEKRNVREWYFTIRLKL